MCMRYYALLRLARTFLRALRDKCLIVSSSLVTRPHPQEGERGLVYNVGILGCAESACSENG